MGCTESKEDGVIKRKGPAKGARRRLSVADLAFGGGHRPSSVYEATDGEDAKWEDTVPKKKLTKLDDKERKRQQVIHELLQTEQSYLRDLIVMKNLFRQSLQDADILTPDQIFGLFTNLDAIIAVNGELFESLASRREDGIVENVGDIFVEMFSGNQFDVYEQFCANQLPASELYTALKAKSPEFVKVMNSCVGNTQESRGFDLPAFLLKGMQRLLKYHPLLQQILKRTKDENVVQVAQLTEAMQLVEEHGRRVNEKVRASENARRLLKIRDSLTKEGKKEFDMDITSDPERHLIFEGKLQHASTASGGKKTLTEQYVILLSDMLLITTERDGKYVIQPGKKPTPVVLIDAITDVKAEMKSATERIRTTLCIEIGDIEDLQPLVPGKDSPRPVMKSTRKQYLRFQASNQGTLRNWIVYLNEGRQNRRDKRLRLYRQMSRGRDDGEVYAVTLLVTTTIAFEQESSTDETDNSTFKMTDWQITFDGEGGGGASQSEVGETIQTTRHVRIVPGLDGSGFTVVGKNPVYMQEVEEGGPAWEAGLRVNDQIRAVNGQECTNMAHHEVVGLIRKALATPLLRWAPVLQPLEAVREEDGESMASSVRGARSLRVAMLEDH